MNFDMEKHKRYKKLLRVVSLCLVLCIQGLDLLAAEEIYFNELRGTSVAVGKKLVVRDEKFHLMDKAAWSQVEHISVKNLLQFELNIDTALFFQAKPFRCTINVTLRSFSDKNDPDKAVGTPKTFDLDIAFDTITGKTYKGTALYKFEGANTFEVTINSISSAELGSSIPAIFRLSGKTVVRRQYPFSDVSEGRSFFSKPAPGKLTVRWTPADYAGAEQFDLEWTYIDSLSAEAQAIRTLYAANGLLNIPDDVLSKWFRNNASRVSVSGSDYTLNLVTEGGYLLYRIRGVQQHYPDQIRYEGNWNYKAVVDGQNCSSAVLCTRFEPSLNWQYAMSFAEEGKRSEVVSYFDGSLRKRQTVTIDNSNEVSIAQETIYDAEGRPALELMPSPVAGTGLGFAGMLSRNRQNKPYSFSDIGKGTGCIQVADQMSDESGAAGYYSSRNSFSGSIHQAFIPSAESYPFTLKTYTADMTGRISSQGGVGKDYQPGTGHETRYFYGKPLQYELDRLFGSEAGLASRYVKNLVVDANGQISVSYVNGAGQTVATALAGAAPRGLAPLSSNGKETVIKVDNVLLQSSDFTYDRTQRKLEASGTFLATSTGIYDFSYELEPGKFLQKINTTDGQLCAQCYYDLVVRVMDNCSKVLYADTLRAGNLFSTKCETTTPLKKNFQVSIPAIGDYHVGYELVISNNALSYYDSVHVVRNTDLKARKDFLREELSKVDLSDCFSDCKTCLVNIGTLPEFMQRFEPLYLSNGYGMEASDSVYVENLYREQLNLCQQKMKEPGCQQSPCEEKLNLLRTDVSPGGQYALYDTTNFTLLEPGLNILSRYREIRLYTDENGNPDSVTLQGNGDADSIRVAVRDLSLPDFIRHFRSSWADSLARLHPEYCYYLWCMRQSASFSFDRELVETITSGKEAMALGYYDRSNFAALLYKDPYFSSSNWVGGSTALRSSMEKALSVFSRSMAGLSLPDKNILQFVDITLYCSGQPTGWDQCSVDTGCRSADREWELYKQLYLQLKQRFYEEGRQSDPAFSGCNNCYIGSDVVGMLGGNSVTPGTAIKIPAKGMAAFALDNGNGGDPGNNQDLENGGGTSGGGGSTGGGGATGSGSGNTNAPKLFPPSPCVSECPEGVYTDGNRKSEGLSYYIVKGLPNVYPGGVPAGYGDCRFYSAFHFINAQTALSCTMYNVWVCIRKTSEIFNFFGPQTPVSTCKDDIRSLLYAAKQRRYMGYTNMSAKIADQLSVNPIAVAEGKKDTLQRDLCSLYAAAQADAWIEQLNDCIADAVKREALRKAFTEIGTAGCMLYGSLENFSSLPDSIALAYHSFEEAMNRILGNASGTMICTVDFLSSAYTYQLRPVTHLPSISTTTYDICVKLDSLKQMYDLSGNTGSFHSWLRQEMGGAFRLNETELNNLLSSCTSCGGMLKESLLLPVPLMNRRTSISCSEADSLKRLFQAAYPALAENHEKYPSVLTNFLNRRLGFALDYASYEAFFKNCSTGSGKRLYDDAMMAPDSLTVDNSCVSTLFNHAAANADFRYGRYIDSVRSAFRNAWLSACAGANTTLRMKADMYEYHYTLYYYDQAGNLVKTVPPAGVKALNAIQIDSVQKDRVTGNINCYTYQDALDLGGSSGRYLPAPGYLSSASVGFAVEMEVLLKDLNSQTIIRNYSPVLRKGWALNIRNGELHILLSQNDSSWQYLLSSGLKSALRLREWSQLVVQRSDMGKMEAIVNGKALALTPITTTDSFKTLLSVLPPERITGIYLGTNGTDSFMNGSIRQFRLYNRVLSAAEIAANKLSRCRTPVNTSGLVAYVPFSEGQGQVKELNRGMQAITIGAQGNWVLERKGILPKHEMATTYVYNSMNAVVEQHTPDAGKTRFFYDKLGRLLASQNANQASTEPAKERYSYTRYDAQNRIVEVGEKSNLPIPANIQYYDLGSMSGWVQNGVNKEVTLTVYDAPNINLVRQPSITGVQRNLRKRVVSMIYKEHGSSAGYDNATHYSYDISGNVQTIWQEIGELRPYSDGGIKRIDYDYDLISGKVNEVNYQSGKGDQFMYRYRYDAQNRLVAVYTSRDSLVWTMEANYRYYLHGPLARMELGQSKVQGIDYAYTLQGWLKGMNATVQSADMGLDGYNGSYTARDVAGFALHYHLNDYQSITATKKAFASIGTVELFNGNISSMTMSNHALGTPLAYGYLYDQLNRLVSKRTFTGLDTARNGWAMKFIPAYQETLRYDANGNIQTTYRYGDTREMDMLTYNYRPGTNRLRHVSDVIPSYFYTTDIDNQPVDNYSYDAIGNLVADKAEKIDSIGWTVYGKIAGIKKRNGTIRYRYDASGNRVYKQSVLDGKTKTEFYVRDAQGNVLGVYDVSDQGLQWQEQHLYGSSRLGVYRYGSTVPLQPVTIAARGSVLQDSLHWGSRVYELSNHLGNVLATVSDKKLQVAGTGNTVAYYKAEILGANDYFAFGSLIEDRKLLVGGGYRYGFNGQERSTEINDNSLTAEYWQYDSRLGRRWNIDPVSKSTVSGYAVLGNNPILYVDPNGADWFKSKGGGYDWKDKSGGKTNFWSAADKNGVRTWYGESREDKMMQGNDLNEVVVTASKKSSHRRPSSELGLKLYYRDIYVQETMAGMSPSQSKHGDEYRSFISKYQTNFDNAVSAEQSYRSTSLLMAGMVLSAPGAMVALETGAASYLWQGTKWALRPRLGPNWIGAAADFSVQTIQNRGRFWENNYYSTGGNLVFNNPLYSGFISTISEPEQRGNFLWNFGANTMGNGLGNVPGLILRGAGIQSKIMTAGALEFRANYAGNLFSIGIAQKNIVTDEKK